MEIFISFFVLVLLSSCVTDTEAGKGPIVLSSTVQVGFEQYLGTTNPKVFVVSEDGNAFDYFYCSDIDGYLASNTTYRALKMCEERSYDQECKIYAIGKKVVWEK